MSTQENLQVIEAYFQNHDEQYLAENVEFFDMTAEQPLRGREAMQKALHLFYAEAFPMPGPRPATWLPRRMG